MPSDMYFQNQPALHLKVKLLDGDGYIALSAIILEGGALWVDQEASVSEQPDIEHTVAIHRDGSTSTIALTAHGLEAVSESTGKPTGRSYLHVQVDNRDRQ